MSEPENQRANLPESRKAKARRKKLIRRIILIGVPTAVLIVIAIVVSVLLISRRNAEKPEEPTIPGNDTFIELAFAGDLNLWLTKEPPAFRSIKQPMPQCDNLVGVDVIDDVNAAIAASVDAFTTHMLNDISGWRLILIRRNHADMGDRTPMDGFSRELQAVEHEISHLKTNHKKNRDKLCSVLL